MALIMDGTEDGSSQSINDIPVHYHDLISSPSLDKQAQKFIMTLARDYEHDGAIGSMTCSIYDTAWLSMIQKPTETGNEWLFPLSFKYILTQQREDGGWESYATSTDGLLNTLASLLSISQHIRHPRTTSEECQDLERRKNIAIVYTQNVLNNWRIAEARQVGIEILAPVLLEMCEKEGVFFHFAGKEDLYRAKNSKLAMFDINMLYGSQPLTALHSLEAFVGHVEFDRVKHHLIDGNMMASPASTAAYLMNAKAWDSTAEEYLLQVVRLGEGKDTGSVPSAYPTTLFEISWVITILVNAGFSRDLFTSPESSSLMLGLKNALKNNQGTIGFAPGLEADADDTAVGISALNLLGYPMTAGGLIGRFEGHNFFKTYQLERNESFSTNCNVLLALLHAPDGINLYHSQVGKLVRFLCSSWWNSRCQVHDKWNLSPLYCTMLMCRALTCFAGVQPRTENLNSSSWESMVNLTVFQALISILIRQNENGSWGSNNGCEETSYAIITVKTITSLQVAQPLRDKIDDCLNRGCEFLVTNMFKSSKHEYLWIEKTAYACRTLSQAYILCALKQNVCPSASETQLGERSIPILMVPGRLLNLCRRLPILSDLPDWRVKASIMGAGQFSTAMRDSIPDIFPRDKMREGSYLDIIPLTWTCGNALEDISLGNQELVDMMVLSAVIYQVDEFMEVTAAQLSDTDLQALKDSLDSMFSESHIGLNDAVHPENTEGAGISQVTLENVQSTLQRFVTYLICHPLISSSRHILRWQLETDIKQFLLGHIRQIRDNHFLAAGRMDCVQKVHGSLFNWLRSTSSDHTGGPFAFTYFLCLLEGRVQTQPQSVEVLYIAQYVSRHLAALCRGYNDWGSFARDVAESNVNAINFEEIRISSSENGSSNVESSHTTHEALEPELCHEQARERLMFIAEYERRCLENALMELKRVASFDVYSAIKAFGNVTDIYGQIYVVKDVTPRHR
ncbi:terpene synthase family protein [Camillea tinctor]|nr:terpene synthase family protein [Camillea tinctor]